MDPHHCYFMSQKTCPNLRSRCGSVLWCTYSLPPYSKSADCELRLELRMTGKSEFDAPWHSILCNIILIHTRTLACIRIFLMFKSRQVFHQLRCFYKQFSSVDIFPYNNYIQHTILYMKITRGPWWLTFDRGVSINHTIRLSDCPCVANFSSLDSATKLKHNTESFLCFLFGRCS